MARLKRRLVALAGTLLCAALLCGHAAAAPASGDDTRLVAQVMSRLAAVRGIRAQFVQTRTLAALQRPIVSQGSLLVVRGTGMIWNIEKPLRATYAITRDRVIEVGASDAQQAGGDAGARRGMGQMASMLDAVMGGDLSALYSQFDVRAQGSPAQWQLQLTPNQPQLAQAVSRLDLSGADFLQSLRIAFANGDAIRIDFTHSVATTPTPAESALLGSAR